MDGWETVVIRAVPFVLMTAMVRTLPGVFEREQAERRLRRALTVQCLWACTFAMFVGSLAKVGVVSGDLATLLYTAVGAVVAIVAAVVLWETRR